MRPNSKKTLFIITALAATTALASACGGTVTGSAPNPNVTDGGLDSSSRGGGSTLNGNGPIEPDVPLVPAKKVDLLLAIDNSASMGDKSRRLAGSIGMIIREVAKVGDVHVGIVSSSLGNFGGNVCDFTNPRTNDRALLRSTDETGNPVPSSSPSGILTYRAGDNLENFVKDTSAAVRGVGENARALPTTLRAIAHSIAPRFRLSVVRLASKHAARRIQHRASFALLTILEHVP